MAKFSIHGDKVPQLHPAMLPQMWKPGQSGNPSGFSKLQGEIMRMARSASPRAITRLTELMESQDERVASVACNSLLERAWGKPKEMDPRDEHPNGVPTFNPRAVTPEQLEIIKQAIRLMQQATTLVEVVE